MAAVAARALRVLIVDDADTVESTRLLLQLDGHEVDTATDGARTVERAVAFRPHLVLLDIGMPGTDGYEVARRIQSLPVPTIPYLAAVTGYGRQDDKRRSAEAGFDLHLTKPVDLGIVTGLLVLLQESREIRDASRRLGEQRRRLLAQSGAALAALHLQQLEMVNYRLDVAAGETATAEVRQRGLAYAGRTCDRVRASLAAHCATGSPGGGCEARCAQERLAQMRR
jgi:CheY-like chemotaxis protein